MIKSQNHSIMKKVYFLSFVCSLFFASLALAQGSFPRVFLDIPSISVFTPDVENFNDQFGAGIGSAINLGTHWGVARLGGGLDALISTEKKVEEDDLIWAPYVNGEVGLGMFRSNGNKCAAHNASAFTAMPIAGYRYDFQGDGSGSPYLAAELGYFYIKDVFKNQEVFLRGDYYTESKNVAIRLGFRMFLNLRADMSRRY